MTNKIYDVWYYYDGTGNVIGYACSSGYETAYNLNHITYRGYYRDGETGFYYLQSRYYDPEIGRFVNADDIDNIGRIENILCRDNLYVYCNSNPVDYSDENGEKATKRHRKELIKDIIIIWYRMYIKAAAKNYKVNEIAVAGAIYAEQVLNYNKIDKLTDRAVYLGIDTSVGLGQVRISTAKLVEDKGYIEKSKNRKERVKRLENNITNIYYVAAYLRYLTDVWKGKFSGINYGPSVLCTLYNTRKTKAHLFPKLNEFGRYVLDKIPHLMKLIS